MSDEERINPGHETARNLLRVVGPLTFAVGGVFMLVGLGSFFSAFGGGGPPSLFWCSFVGMPLMFVGMAVLSKTCPSCGERYDGDAKFCDGCGNRLVSETE